MSAWENNVRRVTPYVPGEQPKGAGFIKLNTNENPYPPAPAVQRVLSETDASELRLYPDPAATDLTEAIALGHDLGHTPFGHAGERALNRLCPGGFTHYRQSLRVVDYLERDGQGLNLTWEVRNGIVTHTSGAWARTPEGCVVRRADHIAFLNHDIEDAVTAGVLDPRQLPPEAVAVLGTTKSQRITTMITNLIEHSQNGRINFSPEVDAAYAVLKDFMYSTVYVDKEAKREEKKVDKLVAELYERLCEEPTLMPNFYLQIAYNEGVDRAVTDYISGMSDEFATRLFEDLFVPQKWTVL